MNSKGAVVFLLCVLTVNAKNIIENDAIQNNTVDLPSRSEAHFNFDNFNSSLTLSSMAHSPRDNIINSLYNEVVSRDFNTAVHRTILLYGGRYDDIIKSAVNQLLTDGRTETIDFAYKLIAVNGADIIRDCFPEEIRMQEKMIFVKIVNKRDGFALKYGSRNDDDGDRTAYGDDEPSKSKSSIIWKFIPYWFEDRVFFKIRPINDAIFLKLSVKTDSDGDYGAYGSSDHDTNRHLWYVKPVDDDGKLLFYIINREHNAALKFGRAVDSDGDRQAYGDPDLDDLTPSNFGWDIRLA